MVDKIDFFKVKICVIKIDLNKYNIEIKENYGFNEKIGYWWFVFIFDFVFEKGIEVCLINFKYSGSMIWMMEIVKCVYLGINSKEEVDFFDMEDEFVNWCEFC